MEYFSLNLVSDRKLRHYDSLLCSSTIAALTAASSTIIRIMAGLGTGGRLEGDFGIFIARCMSPLYKGVADRLPARPLVPYITTTLATGRKTLGVNRAFRFDAGGVLATAPVVSGVGAFYQNCAVGGSYISTSDSAKPCRGW